MVLSACSPNKDEQKHSDHIVWNANGKLISLISPEGGALDEPQNILSYSADGGENFIQFLNVRFCIDSEVVFHDAGLTIHYDDISYVHSYTDNSGADGIDVSSCRKGQSCSHRRDKSDKTVKLRCYE